MRLLEAKRVPRVSRGDTKIFWIPRRDDTYSTCGLPFCQMAGTYRHTDPEILMFHITIVDPGVISVYARYARYPRMYQT